MKWKILLPIIILALIAFIIGIFFHLQSAMEEASQSNNIVIPPPEEKPEEPEIVVNVFPDPTGNIDDTINALLNSLSDEETLMQDEKEAEAIGEESQALSDFGQSYDESEF